jgi:hypothetical protein
MRILLVHGLGRTPLSMLRLASDLRRAGAEPWLFGYVPAVERFDRIVGRLQIRMQALAQTEYAAVGHSLGGLLLRAAVAGLAPGVRLPTHLVLLGTPNQAPCLALRVRGWPLFRIISGEAGRLLASPARMAALPVPAVPLTVIAGTAGPTSRWAPFGGQANDGMVAVNEARLGAHEEFIELPVWHAFMMNHPRVRQLVRERCLKEEGRSKT